LKTARLVFSFAGRARESDFLALVDLDVLFFDILPPASLVPLAAILAGLPSWSPEGAKQASKKVASGFHHNALILN
jgi:hypothetical protein